MTDYDYEFKRKQLIPHAEAFANNKHGKFPSGNREIWSQDWNITFLEKMDEMAREKGLIK